MFVCTIPGADDGTAFWHAVIHYGLAAIVVTVGVVFLALAVMAYRADAPAQPELAATPSET